MTILDTIVEVKKREVEKLSGFAKPEIGHELVRGHRFSDALRGRDVISLIAEVKKASPSEGVIRDDFDPVKLAQAYEAAGAAAISVITDEQFFQGSLDYLKQVAKVSSLPVLRKDFIIDEAQVFESYEAGASAVLLIVAILGEEPLFELRELAESLGMEALVEVHDAAELELALRSGATIVGINNRDLHTFSVDLQTTLDLLEKIPDDVLVVSESGIRNHRDRQRLDGRVDAVLVGTSILKFPDVGLKIHELFMNRPLLKICGIKDVETAHFCEEEGVELLGFNFIKESSRFIEPKEAHVITELLTQSKSVGLFRNESVEFVNKTAEALDLDFVQLHGTEDEAYCNQIERPVIKSFLPEETPFYGVIPLFDLPKGSSGVIQLENQPVCDYFLAGGLEVSNVTDVLQGHQPFVVDVARGVETVGQKDFQKIKQFINQL